LSLIPLTHNFFHVISPSHPTLHLLFLLTPPPPRSTLFPYTTLFRSRRKSAGANISKGSCSLTTFTARTNTRVGCLKPACRRFALDRKSTRLNFSHEWISYAVFCLKKKKERTKYYVARTISRLYHKTD